MCPLVAVVVPQHYSSSVHAESANSGSPTNTWFHGSFEIAVYSSSIAGKTWEARLLYYDWDNLILVPPCPRKHLILRFDSGFAIFLRSH